MHLSGSHDGGLFTRSTAVIVLVFGCPRSFVFLTAKRFGRGLPVGWDTKVVRIGYEDRLVGTYLYSIFFDQISGKINFAQNYSLYIIEAQSSPFLPMRNHGRIVDEYNLTTIL